MRLHVRGAWRSEPLPDAPHFLPLRLVELDAMRVQIRRAPSPPLPRTNRTSLVPPLVLSGHAASQTSAPSRVASPLPPWYKPGAVLAPTQYEPGAHQHCTLLKSPS